MGQVLIDFVPKMSFLIIIILFKILKPEDKLSVLINLNDDNGKLLLDDKPKEILKRSETHNSIYLSVEEKNPAELKKEILDKKISKDVTIANNYCVVKTNNSKFIKKSLDDFIKINKFTMKHYSIGKGSLEEVFRRLTGNE